MDRRRRRTLLALSGIAGTLVLAALLIVQADPEPEATPPLITVSVRDVTRLRKAVLELSKSEGLREIPPYSLRTRVMSTQLLRVRPLLAESECTRARLAAEADGRISLLERWRTRRAC